MFDWFRQFYITLPLTLAYLYFAFSWWSEINGDAQVGMFILGAMLVIGTLKDMGELNEH